MFLLAAASCGMVSCQQEEGLTSPTLAKSTVDSDILVDSLYYTFDTENRKATIECFEYNIYKEHYFDTNAESIKFPDNVTYNNVVYTITGLGEYATKGRQGSNHYYNIGNYLNKVELPKQLETIGNSSLALPKLKEIALPETVIEIGNRAFSSCKSLESLRLPSKLETIKSYAFNNCTSLVTVIFPENLKKIEGYAFYGCSSLKSIELPDSTVNIGGVGSGTAEGYAFAGCTSLLTAKIPNVEIICAHCFDGDTQLQNVTLGTGLKIIYWDAFKDCTNMKQLCVYATTPPRLVEDGTNIFSSTNYENCTLYVPAEAEATYKAADGWKNFKNISTQFPDEQTAEEMQASFTDATPTLDEGTYKAGKLTYTRSGKNIIDGNYATFCLPFDINLADTKCFSDVLVPQNIALYQTNNNGMLTFLLDQVESDAIIPAGKPFIAKLNGNDVELKNYYSTFIRSTYQEDLKQNMETTIKVFNFDGSSGVLQRNNDVEVKFCGTFNKKAEMDKETTRTFTVRGSFAPDTSVSAFRAYIYKNSKSGNTQVSNLSWSLGDDLQSISSGNYIVDGNELIINK